MDPAINLALRLGIAVLFFVAAVQKMRNLTSFRQILAGYLRGLGMGDRGLEQPMPVLIVCVELLIVGSCLLPESRILAGVLAGAVLQLYAVAMALTLLRGRRTGVEPIIDCGCSWGSRRQPVRRALVLRNLVLALAASMIALPVEARMLGGLEIVSAGLAVVIAILLYTAVHQLPGHMASDGGGVA